MASWEALLRSPSEGATRTRVVAHRGYSGRAPENTLPAFEAAVGAGADAMEMDVQLSRDGVVVVVHDATLDRTTNGRGPVTAMDAEALAALDAGAWFGPAYAGTPLPTLQAVLRRFGVHAALNLELKAGGDGPDGLEDAVLALVGAWAAPEAVALSSFSIARLERLRDLGWAGTLGWAVEAVPEEGVLRGVHDSLHLDFVAPDVDLLEEGRIATLQAAGLAVVPWTVNDAPTMRRLVAAGVEAFFSDEVEVALSVVEEA